MRVSGQGLCPSTGTLARPIIHLQTLAEHLSEEERPPGLLFESLGSFYEAGPAQCLDPSLEGKESLSVLGIGVR